ncbi:MAG TPA: tetratricopeptide repeat protein [Spirochaetota bacterium]|nr:tetratricopeptide repeat protein [Spirochaetota bacterium]
MRTKILTTVMTIIVIIFCAIIYLTVNKGEDISDTAAINFSSKMLRQGEVEVALSILNKKIKAGTDNPLIFYNAGVVLLNKREYSKAVELFSESIRLDPSVSALNNRAFCYTTLNESKKAIDDYTAILEIDENQAASYLRRGQLYFNIGDFKSAKVDLEKASSLGLKEAKKLLKKME